MFEVDTQIPSDRTLSCERTSYEPSDVAKIRVIKRKFHGKFVIFPPNGEFARKFFIASSESA